MKYLKTFEENKREIGKFYWALKNDPKKFKKQLKKIGCPEITVKKYTNKLYLFDEDTLFVGVESNSDYNNWSMSSRGLNFTGYEYKGPIILSRDELDEIEAEEKSMKYNL